MTHTTKPTPCRHPKPEVFSHEQLNTGPVIEWCPICGAFQRGYMGWRTPKSGDKSEHINRLVALRETREALSDYGRHKEDCQIDWPAPGMGCTCGWDECRKQLDKEGV